MPQNDLNTPTGITLVTSNEEKELTEQYLVKLLQIKRLKNIPYHFGMSNKEK